MAVSGEVQFSPALNLGKLKYSMASNCSHAYRKHLLIAYLIEKKNRGCCYGSKAMIMLIEKGSFVVIYNRIWPH